MSAFFASIKFHMFQASTTENLEAACKARRGCLTTRIKLVVRSEQNLPNGMRKGRGPEKAEGASEAASAKGQRETVPRID